jgi:hypothetical protein
MKRKKKGSARKLERKVGQGKKYIATNRKKSLLEDAMKEIN